MTRIRVTLWFAAVVAAVMLAGVALHSFPRQVTEPVAERVVCDGPARVRVIPSGDSWDRNFGRVQCMDRFGQPVEDVTAVAVSIVSSAALALVVALMLLFATIDKQQRQLRYQARLRARAHMG